MENKEKTKEVITALRGFYTDHIQALNGVLGKLPESLRTELQGLRDKLNGQLEALKPIDQVPAAQEAAWAFNGLTDALVRMQEYATGLVERLQGMSQALTAKATEFNGLQERITKGELLTKDLVEAAVGKARQEGIDSVMPNVISLRQSQVELAGLPAAPEAMLKLGAAEWTAALDAAKANLAALAAKGMKPGGKGDAWVKKTTWLGTAEFAGEMKLIEELVPAAGKTVDPLLGNKGDTGTQGRRDAGTRKVRLV